MQGITCLCVVLMVLLATWGSVQGVSHDKLAHNSRLSKLRKMTVQDKAQRQALRIVQAAQDAVATEQQQQALMSIEVASTKEDKKADSTENTEANADADADAASDADAAAATEAKTEVEVEADPACCGNAQDPVARAGNAANQQSLSDMQAQVKALTDEITKAAAPPNVNPGAMNEENAAIIGNSGTTAPNNGGGGPMPSTGTNAECNGHLDSVTLHGDPDIWKEEEQAKQDALNKLLQKVEPQFTTGMATDSATFTKTKQLMTDNDAKDKDFKSQLKTSCAEATCDLGASGGLLVEPDTSS